MTTAPPPLDLLGADAMQLGHTINMVADLPRYMLDGTTAYGPTLHPHVRHAISEAFATNARLLAGFILDHLSGNMSAEELDFLDQLQLTVNAHVTNYGPERRDQPLLDIPADEWRARLLELLDQVPLPEPLATWRSNARWIAQYVGLDVHGEWQP